jgi:hypothetical protein
MTIRDMMGLAKDSDPKAVIGNLGGQLPDLLCDTNSP